MAGGFADAGDAPTLGQILAAMEKAAGANKGGGGGDSASENKQRLQAYRALLIELYGLNAITDLQKKMMNKAAQLKLPASTFLSLLRRYDPRYVRSDDYRNRVASATLEWNKWFPKQKMPERYATSFARSGKSSAWLKLSMQNSREVQKAYPFLKVAQMAGNAAGFNPATYRAYRDSWNRAMRAFNGRQATKQEMRMMFDSTLTDDQFTASMAEVFGGLESLAFVRGTTPTTKQKLQGALNPLTNPLLNQIGSAKRTQASFLGSGFKPFGIQTDEETGQIVMPRI